MPRHVPLSLALVLSALALASCSETPTQPPAAGNPSAAVTSLALPSNSWTAKAPLPCCRSSSGVVAGDAVRADGQRIVYVFGGIDSEGDENTAIRAYNLVTNAWTLKAGRAAVSSSNGVGKIGALLYISGGITLGGGEFTMLSQLVAYDPFGDRIIRKANMPRPTARGVTGVLNGKLYVLSGECTDDEGPVFDCEPGSVFHRLLYRYDPATNSWATLAPSPHSHRGGAGGFINGKFYVAGGQSNSLDVYDPFSNTWTTLAPLPSPRGVGVIMASKLWMIGVSGSNRTTYVYDPVTNRWSPRAPFPTGQTAPFAAVPFPSDGQSHFLTVGGSQGDFPDDRPAPSQLYTR